jgi:glycerol-3-phosphate O-acyltransferase
LIGELERLGSYVHIPRADRDYAIAVGLRMLTLRHLVIEADETYSANPKERVLLQYYANAIVHLFKDNS